MQLQEVAEPFPASYIQTVEISRLLLDRIAKGERLDFLKGRRQEPEPTIIAAPVIAPETATKPRISDRDVVGAALAVARVTAIAALWLRRDLALAYADPTANHRSLIEDIGRRARVLRAIAATRDLAIASEPRLAQWWTEKNNALTLQAASESDRIIAELERGNLPQLPREDAALELVRVLLTYFGTAEWVPESVIEFCRDEGISFSFALLTASKIAHQSFPDAHAAAIEMVDDAEGSSDWVTLRVSVPAKDSVSRYRACVAELVKQVPVEELHKIRVDYVPQ